MDYDVFVTPDAKEDLEGFIYYLLVEKKSRNGAALIAIMAVGDFLTKESRNEFPVRRHPGKSKFAMFCHMRYS